MFCCRSIYLRRLRFKEATDNKVTLNDDDPLAVEALIHYLYNFEYDTINDRQTDVPQIVLDVRVWVIADKYFVEPLKELAAEYFEGRNCNEWMEPDFAKAIVEVYTTTLEGCALRESIIFTVRDCPSLLDPKEGHTDFLKVLRETPGLGADILIQMHTKN